jgi:hypothetical protein
MNWSISAHKIFHQCQRKWFYKVKAADARVKKGAERIEITRLSNLITIDSWRGQIVDLVITEILIKKFRRKEKADLSDLLIVAKKVFDKQYALATQKDSEGNLPNIGWGFVDIEYGLSISNDAKLNAWRDIEVALQNFMQDDILLNDLSEADLLLPQWTFQFKKGNINVKCIPDLVAFYRNKPPTIYDWKVNTFATNSNEDQLLAYALALTNAKPQDSYSKFIDGVTAQDIKLVEYQLLAGEKGIRRNYEIDQDDICRIDNLISKSALQIYGKNGFNKYDSLYAGHFETTNYPENCKNCQFKKICKEVNYEIRD